MYYLPIRKIMKCVRSKNNRIKQERPSCLTECLLNDKEEQTKRELKRDQYFLFITFTIFLIVLYSMGLHVYSKTHVIQNANIVDDNINEEIKVDSKRMDLPICYVNTSYLGQVKIKKLVMKEVLESIYPNVQKGGVYVPKDCRPRSKVGILVPFSNEHFRFRDRAQHLSVFLYNIHPFLIKQKLEYRIFVIEQAGLDLFNRGRLFNAGFKEMMKLGDWKCVIFHDVDLLPLDENILYSCPIWPRNMCANIVDVKDPKFRTLFGGVSAMDIKHFRKVNGYSNDYWGWGGEDNDLFRRLQSSGYPVVQYNGKVARYTSLPHLKQQHNRARYNLLKKTIVKYKHEGLSTLHYKVLSLTLYHLYTHITVDINPSGKTVKEEIFK